MDRYLGGDSDINKKFSRQFKISVIMLIVVILGLIITIITQRDSIVSWGNDVINFLNTTIEISRMAIIGWILLFLFIGILLTIIITTNKFKKTKWYEYHSFKSQKIPNIIDMIENRIKPQLEKKVLNPNRIIDMKVQHLDTYVQTWMGGCANEYGVAYWLKQVYTLDHYTEKNILIHYPNLKSKINSLDSLLKQYDSLFCQLLQRLERYMNNYNKDREEGNRLNWLDIESWIYKTFNIDDDYRRYGKDVIDWNNDIEIEDEGIKENLNNLIEKINEKADVCKQKCDELINLKKRHWKKEKRWYDGSVAK